MPFTTPATVRDALSSSFDELEAFFLLPCERLHQCPPRPDAWSIANHLEHVSLANHFLLLTIGKGCRKALRRARTLPIPQRESDLQILSAIAIPGSFQWPPPLHMVPSGKMDLAAIHARLTQQRQDSLDLLDSIAPGVGHLASFSMSVNSLGRLDMYQWLYFLAQHSRYHIALINEDFSRH